MSTNFYACVVRPTEHGTCTEHVHIGQRAGGWQFLFQADRKHGVTDWYSWKAQLEAARAIWDEYGARYTAIHMLDQVNDCRSGRQRELYGDAWHDRTGHTFSEEWFS
jgi:hypothetical protein